MGHIRFAVLALCLYLPISWAQVEEPTVYFSLTESMAELEPLSNAKVPPGPVWFLIEPGERWERNNYKRIGSWCCKQIMTRRGGPRALQHGPKQEHAPPGPHIDYRDLTDAKLGTSREFYMDGYFDGYYEANLTHFVVSGPVEYKLKTENCRLEWEPSEDEKIGLVAGYRVYLTRLGIKSLSITDVGLRHKASCNEIGAIEGRNNAIVRAYNQDNIESPDSNKENWIIVTEPPRPPSNLINEGSTLEQCTLLWSASPDEDRGIVSGYLVSISQNQDFSGAIEKNIGLVDSVLCREIGAAPGKNYVKVRSYNPAGESSYTEPLEFEITDTKVCEPLNVTVVDD